MPLFDVMAFPQKVVEWSLQLHSVSQLSWNSFSVNGMVPGPVFGRLGSGGLGLAALIRGSGNFWHVLAVLTRFDSQRQ